MGPLSIISRVIDSGLENPITPIRCPCTLPITITLCASHSLIQPAQLCYTPMINAKMFSPPSAHAYRAQAFNTSCLEEGSNTHDRPLIVQFCANNPSQLLTSALAVQDHCDAVDINLGCPQDIARKGHYGSFLMDEWELIHDLSAFSSF
jgi:tRNA-dihydrouridine synthase